MLTDLHIHTYFSDGSLSPDEVVQSALQKGLSVISICDHDTIGAYNTLPRLCAEADILLIQGVEIDVVWQDKFLHLLAYGFDPENPDILQVLNKSRYELDQISVEMVSKMQKDFPNINPADYKKYEYKLGNGGWKGINYFKDRGLTNELMDGLKFFSKYGTYKPDFIAIADVCKTVREAGGYPVLAHPGNWWLDKPDELDNILTDIWQSGIAGIECYYPSHTNEFTNRCVSFCKNHDLLITCGGDGHGNFCNLVDGIEYDIGIMKVDSEKLNLKWII